MDPESDGHAAGGDREQGSVGAGQGAARERDSHRAGALVRQHGDALDPVEVKAGCRGGAGDLEHGEVAGDTAALVCLVGSGAEDVVGHRDGAAVDAVRADRLLCGAEVQHVSRVVAVAQKDAPALFARSHDGFDLSRGRRGEEVPIAAPWARPGPTRPAKAGSDPTRRRSPGHLGFRRPRRAGDASGHGPDPPPVGTNESSHHLVGECRWIIPEPRHDIHLPPSFL